MLGIFAILPGRLSWMILLRQSQKEVICCLQVWMPRCWGSVVGGPTVLEGSGGLRGQQQEMMANCLCLVLG